MNLTTLMKIGENITDSSSLGDRATVGLQVIAIGMGVVFGVLILLIGILQLFKVMSIKKTVDGLKEAQPSVAPIATASAVAINTSSSSEEEKIVAIATAAIAAERDESECSFNVISIKKIVK